MRPPSGRGHEGKSETGGGLPGRKRVRRAPLLDAASGRG